MENVIKKKIKIKTKKNYIPKKGEIILVEYSKDKFSKAEVMNVSNDSVKVKHIEKKIVNQLGKNSSNYNLKKIKKISKAIYNSETNKIIPEKWVPINKKRFISWINQTFLPYRIQEKENNKKLNVFEPRPYQKFVRDYLSFNSPYRGILLYHGLGSGKTCTSITIAENLKSAKNIVVMLPASLRSNYVHSLINDCGSAYKKFPELVTDKYTFISYNASNTLDQLDKIQSLDDHVIIIDEIHNLVSMMVTKSKKGPAIYKKLMEAKNAKIIALSGTPVINFPFEIAKLANILRGYIKVSIFYVKNVSESYGQIWELDKIVSKLNDIDGIEYIDIEQRYLHFYLSEDYSNDNRSNIISNIMDLSSDNGVQLQFIETKKYTLFPEEEEQFRKYFIEETPDGEILKNENLLKRRMIGLISYYRGGKPIYYPTLNPIHFIDIPMSDYQFREYESVRDIEREKEKGSALKKLMQSVSNSKSKGSSEKKANSLFRVFSREFSNFVFPESIERPFLKKFLKSSKKKSVTLTQEEIKLLEKENEMQNEGTNITRKDKQIIEEALEKLDKTKNIYLVDKDNGLQKYSPKMAKMLENINKSPGLVFVYSNFRTLEGVGIFSIVLRANGYSQYVPLSTKLNNNNKNKLRYAIWSGSESQEEKEDILKKFNNPDNKYGNNIKILLATAAGAEGIDLKNIRQVHIMEPYWHEVRISQVIGRANRLNSHIELPLKDRTVDVYRYSSIYSKEQEKIAKDKVTTDEYMYDVAKRKLVVTNQIKQITKEISVDCTLNAVDNEKTLKCFSFGASNNLSGLSYKADIVNDFVFGKSELATKTVDRKLVPMIMDSDNIIIRPDKKKKQLCYYFDNECKNPIKEKPKKIKKIAVDQETNEVFDLASAKINNPIKIGDIDENGKLV